MAKQSRSRARKSPRRPASSLTLIEIDQQPFLKKAASACRRLRTELANKQEQLRKFEEEAVAEFDQWLNRTHGAELTRIRELRREIEEWEFIFAQLRALEWTHPEALEEEFEDLLKRRENGTLPDYVPLRFRRGSDGEDHSGDGDSEEDVDDMDDFEDFDEAFEAEFEKFFENMGGGFGDFDAFGSGGRGERESGDDAIVRLKATYRLLAKRLHPDLSDLPADQREKRWHELQEAYQQSDIEGMQRIEAVCDMDRTGITTKLGLARLSDLIDYHQSHLGPLRQAIREAKRHPAFPHPKKKREQIRQEVSCEIRESVEGLEEDAREIREFVEEIASFGEKQEPVRVAAGQSNGSPKPAGNPKPSKPRARKKPKPRPADDPRQMDLFDF
jgi:archaellum component FlaC